MQPCGIYKIQSKLKPERFYIGSALKMNKRWNRHRYDLRRNKHGSIKLQRHFIKYGIDDLDFTIVEPCLPQFLIIREQYYLSKYMPYFNICMLAGNSLGRIVSDETRNKLSKAAKGKKLGPMSEEHRIKCGMAAKGKHWKLSDEKREKMRIRAKSDGRKMPNTLGYKHTDETKMLMSKQRAGKIRGPYKSKSLCQ